MPGWLAGRGIRKLFWPGTLCPGIPRGKRSTVHIKSRVLKTGRSRGQLRAEPDEDISGRLPPPTIRAADRRTRKTVVGDGPHYDVGQKSGLRSPWWRSRRRQLCRQVEWLAGQRGNFRPRDESHIVGRRKQGYGWNTKNFWDGGKLFDQGRHATREVDGTDWIRRVGEPALDPSAATSTPFSYGVVLAPPRCCGLQRWKGDGQAANWPSPADCRTAPRISPCRRSDEVVSVAGKREQGCLVRWCGEWRGEG